MGITIHIISGVFIALGCLFVVGGAVGLIRMPDFFTRIHAASVTDTGGILFIFIGLILEAWFTFDNPLAAVKLFLAVLFVYFTAPTASHAIAKAALMSGVIPRCPNGRSVVHESLANMYHDKSENEKLDGSL